MVPVIVLRKNRVFPDRKVFCRAGEGYRRQTYPAFTPLDLRKNNCIFDHFFLVLGLTLC
jgi:hypothetical protein